MQPVDNACNLLYNVYSTNFILHEFANIVEIFDRSIFFLSPPPSLFPSPQVYHDGSRDVQRHLQRNDRLSCRQNRIQLRSPNNPQLFSRQSHHFSRLRFNSPPVPTHQNGEDGRWAWQWVWPH